MSWGTEQEQDMREWREQLQAELKSVKTERDALRARLLDLEAENREATKMIVRQRAQLAEAEPIIAEPIIAEPIIAVAAIAYFLCESCAKAEGTKAPHRCDDHERTMGCECRVCYPHLQDDAQPVGGGVDA